MSLMLEPPIDDDEVKELYKAVEIYLQRVEGKKAKPFQPKLININPNVIPLSKQLYYSLRNRLELIEKYKIRDKEKILRLLTTAFSLTEKISIKELTVLKEIVNNPETPYYKIAKKIGMAPSTVINLARRLERKVNLRYTLLPDYTLFKLRHYSIIFSIDNNIAPSVTKFLTSPFTLTINIDTFAQRDRRWGWASFIVPNQPEILSRFHRWISRFQKNAYYLRIMEITKIAYGINLDLYDGTRWIFEDYVWSYGLFELMREHWELFKPQRVYEYKNTPIKFDDIDFIIFSFLIKNEKFSLKKMQENLADFGIKRSISDISKRIKKIKLLNIPIMISFSGLDLTDMLTVHIECNNESKEILLRSLSQFPMYWLYPHSYGLFAFLLMPRGTAFSYVYLFEGIRSEFEDVVIIPRYTNLGGRLNARDLIKFWNTEKQKWIVPNNIFR